MTYIIILLLYYYNLQLQQVIQMEEPLPSKYKSNKDSKLVYLVSQCAEVFPLRFT